MPLWLGSQGWGSTLGPLLASNGVALPLGFNEPDDLMRFCLEEGI